MIDCGCCGSAIVGRDVTPGVYHEDEVIVCGDCGAKNVMSADGEDAWVRSWTCVHGKEDDEPCPECEEIA